MSMFPLCDEQKYIFDVNEAIKSMPMKIWFDADISDCFSKEDICRAVEKCIQPADVFHARCVVKDDDRQYMEFLPPQKVEIHALSFSSEEAYLQFREHIAATEINNRDKLYHIFVFSIAGARRNRIIFCFNHLIFDGISALVLLEKIQHVLLDDSQEVIWHPFSCYLDKMDCYNKSAKYLTDQAFWENRFGEISNCEYLFRDVIDVEEAPIRELNIQTSHTFKREFLAYCTQNKISPHLLIATVLAELIHAQTGCKRFYFEIPIGNRLGVKEKNSIGPYEIGPPFIFDFNENPGTWDLLASVIKQSTDYYKHKNFDWNTKIFSEPYTRKYGRYIPQFCFSYFCFSRNLVVPFANWRHLHIGNDFLPMTLYIADYIDWDAFTFSYVFWDHYFTGEDVTEIHKDIEARITNIVENLKIEGGV